MCGRIVLVWDAHARRFVRKYADPLLASIEARRLMEKDSYNVPPTTKIPVLHGGAESTELATATWGIPSPQRPGGVFNTRIETAAQSPMWRSLLGRNHAVVIAKGFYEWRGAGAVKVPHFIHRKDGEPLALAALAATQKGPQGPQLCVSIVTCAPNPLVARLHDRMPVILEEGGVEDWLHPERTGLERIRDLAVPAGDVLSMHAVGSGVNSTKNDAPNLIEPTLQRTLEA